MICKQVRTGANLLMSAKKDFPLRTIRHPRSRRINEVERSISALEVVFYEQYEW